MLQRSCILPGCSNTHGLAETAECSLGALIAQHTLNPRARLGCIYVVSQEEIDL